MSVLIKGIDTPKSCSECKLRYVAIGLEFQCAISGETVDDFYETRHPNCALVELPTPHGRLIDADELFCKIDGIKGWDYGDESDMAISAAEALSAIDDSPTIIEAEVSE